MVELRTIGQAVVVLIGALLAAVVGGGLFVAVPLYTDVGVLEVVLALVAFGGGLFVTGRVASNVFPGYNVAEVEVSGPITRDGGSGPLPMGRPGPGADDIVEQIERADADGNARGLVVKLNTPGGQVVPSEDIRRAAAEFDGPTVAYAEDMAASGGYWIASGCDHFHAREESLVGSIGVNGTQFGLTDFADRAGIDYRRFVAGDYKDTPSSWRELSEDEEAYFQGLLDDWYDGFVETVVEGRDMDPEFVRDTEARVYVGREAVDEGIVDTAGPREEMDEWLADRVGVDEVTVEEFEPQAGLAGKVGMGARSVAYALGAGVTSALVGDDGELKIRV